MTGLARLGTINGGMQCYRCDREVADDAESCAHCGQDLRIEDREAAKTTAWSAQPPPPSQSSRWTEDDLDGLVRPRRRGRWLAVAGVVVGIAAAVTIAVAASRGDADPPPSNRATAKQAADGERWWIPPAGKRTSIEALAYAFATIDENNLGDLFDKDLKPVYGAGSFFEEHEPRRLQRNEMSHAWVKLRNRLQLRAGFDVLVARAGGTYTTDKEYQLYRALQIREVVSVDETKRMREPPEGAIFYLAEIHRGHAYDMLVQGDHREMGAELDVKVEVPVSAKALDRSDKIKVTHQGLGLEPIDGDAIFAMTPEEVHRNYMTTGEPMIVKLVFRTIPGRSVKSHELPTPKVIVDEKWTLDDNAHKDVALGPGRYQISTQSEPKGLHLLPIGDMSCTPSLPNSDEYRRFDATCTVTRPTQLRVSNYMGILRGPREKTSVYIAKLPD